MLRSSHAKRTEIIKAFVVLGSGWPPTEELAEELRRFVRDRLSAHAYHHQPLDDGLKAIGIPQVRYFAGLTAIDKHQKAIIEALAPQGALAMIDDPTTFGIVPYRRKSLSVHWELMFTRALDGTADMAHSIGS